MRWTRKGIVAEIRRLHEAGAELNYATAETRYLNLVRASAWHFGTWKMAIEAAGLDYNALSKYRRWSRDLIVQRIRDLHKEGKDLSWRSISVEIDPPLAAAALRPNGFTSWREALAAAGLDPNDVSRYESWNSGRVVQEIKTLHRRNMPLSSKTAQQDQPKLFTAARRRFGSWDGALAAAGLNADKIRLRRATGAESSPRSAASQALEAVQPVQLQLGLPAAPAKKRATRAASTPAAKATAIAAKPVLAKSAAPRPTAKNASAKPTPVKATVTKAAPAKVAVPKAPAKAPTAKTPAVKAPAAKPASAKPIAPKASAAKASAPKAPAKTAAAKAPATKTAAPAKEKAAPKAAPKSASAKPAKAGKR